MKTPRMVQLINDPALFKITPLKWHISILQRGHEVLLQKDEKKISSLAGTELSQPPPVQEEQFSKYMNKKWMDELSSQTDNNNRTKCHHIGSYLEIKAEQRMCCKNDMPI